MSIRLRRSIRLRVPGARARAPFRPPSPRPHMSMRPACRSGFGAWALGLALLFRVRMGEPSAKTASPLASAPAGTASARRRERGRRAGRPRARSWLRRPAWRPRLRLRAGEAACSRRPAQRPASSMSRHGSRRMHVASSRSRREGKQAGRSAVEASVSLFVISVAVFKRSRQARQPAEARGHQSPSAIASCDCFKPAVAGKLRGAARR
jgi:hypothetical protein